MIPPDATYGPLDDDAAIPGSIVVEAIGQLDETALLVDTVSTYAAEAMQNSGRHHQHVVMLELEGRHNRTDERGKALGILDPQAAAITIGNLVHTLEVLGPHVAGPLAAGVMVVDRARLEALVAQALATSPGAASLNVLGGALHIEHARRLVAGLRLRER